MSQDDKDRLRDEYDFSGGTRGKHHRAYRGGSNVVLSEPDVAEALDDAVAENRMLQATAQTAQNSAEKVPGG